MWWQRCFLAALLRVARTWCMVWFNVAERVGREKGVLLLLKHS